MGRDKAGVIVDGGMLWERQLATLRGTGPAEVFISGKPDGPYAGTEWEIVTDREPSRGPLSGIEAALQRSSHPFLLVLAIDLPAMTSEFLSRLIAEVRRTGTGVVPRRAEWFEPLAAVYPRACLSLVQDCLRGEDYSMRSFVRRALELQLLSPLEINDEDAALFQNVNTPADF